MYSITRRKEIKKVLILGHVEDWMQVMDRSYEEGYKGNCFSSSNFVMEFLLVVVISA